MNWLQRLFRTRKQEKDLDAELRFHIEEQIAHKIDAGTSPAEARRRVQLEFGGMEQIKEQTRESRGTLWLASIAQDLRFGLRILARSAGFSFTAILVLALGIGVNTLAFSLYDLYAVQSMPVRDPATLVNLRRHSPENLAPSVPYPSIAYYRDHAHSVSAVIESIAATPMLLENDEHRVKASFVSANYFSELGSSAYAGRLLDSAREDKAGADPVAVLSYRFWQLRFNSDPALIGKTVHLDGKPATIIGVASENTPALDASNPDVWLPIQQHSYFIEGSKPLDEPEFASMIFMWARLAPGVTAQASEKEMLTLTNQLRKLYPKVIWDNERIEISSAAHVLSSEELGPVVPMVSLLVLLILAVACANLGGLLMARGAGRQREIRTRLDLGAGRLRLFRQLFTESLLLGMLGSVAALPLSYVSLRLALHYADAPVWMSAAPDWRMLVFTAAIGFVAVLLFGLLPTLQMVRRSKKKTVANEIVVCVQVAASCVLLILAGLLVRATIHAIYSNPGFGYQQVLSIDPALGDHGFTPSTAQVYLDQLQSRLRTVPGVTSVSLALSPPLVTNDVMISSIDVDGHRIMFYPNWVTPEFFETMGIPLLRGRYLLPNEEHAVVLSESLARKCWPNEDPIGKPWKGSKNIVVGIVGNTRAMELNNSDATEIYYPPRASNFPGMSVLVRASGTPESLGPAIKSIAASVHPGIYPTMTPLKEGFSKSLGQVEQVAAIVSILGGIAIFLAVVGLLGIVAYAVAQRTKEIAIRLALGAGRGEIVFALLRRYAWSLVVGLAAGTAATAALSQLIRRGLFGVSALDPISYVGAVLFLVAVFTTAALLPIRRAFRLDVARILHTE